MKVSVLVIAHNEQSRIGACIESLLHQSRKADEIIVVNHNSSDQTGAIARTYGVTVIEYTGPEGPAYARIKGFEITNGDIILCIDGDSYASRNWVFVLCAIFESRADVKVVGSWVRMTGLLLAHAATVRWYFFCNAKGGRATDYVYGASYGIRGADKEFAIQALKQGLNLSIKLNLAYNPDDYWLALFMNQIGDTVVTNKTSVTAHAKERTSVAFIRRSLVAYGIRSRIHKHLRSNNLPPLKLI